VSERPPELQRIDALGLKCPLPVLLVRRALARAAPGGIIELHADDALAHIDVPAFCAAERHALLDVTAAGEGRIFRIRRA
jgi:tRNA 2-thiouridine synthesizing protein A